VPLLLPDPDPSPSNPPSIPLAASRQGVLGLRRPAICLDGNVWGIRTTKRIAPNSTNRNQSRKRKGKNKERKEEKRSLLFYSKKEEGETKPCLMRGGEEAAWATLEIGFVAWAFTSDQQPGGRRQGAQSRAGGSSWRRHQRVCKIQQVMFCFFGSF